jgi:hypothetical protein
MTNHIEKPEQVLNSSAKDHSEGVQVTDVKVADVAYDIDEVAGDLYACLQSPECTDSGYN